MENGVNSWLASVLVVLGLMSLRLLLRRQRQKDATTDPAAAPETKPSGMVALDRLWALVDVAIIVFMVSMLVLLYRESPEEFLSEEPGTVTLAVTMIAIAIFRRWKRL